MTLRPFRAFAALALVLGLFVSHAVAQSTPAEHLALGNPSGAVASTAYPQNYLMTKQQFVLSYWRDGGVPNWVSWHLGASDLGSAPRSNSFITDTALPAGWYRVTSSDYTGSGYDRGHNCPSADRTRTTDDNKATFLMTNIMPQAPDNNQGPWANLEDYCRELVTAGNELYIICGGDDSLGRIPSGRANIPAFTWKVIVVIPQGANDLARINSGTRVIAVELPNQQGIRDRDWRSFRVSVDHIEYYTGYNFLTNLSSSLQATLEARVDAQ